MKKISNMFLVLAVLLSDVMCAVVAYNFCRMQWGARYAMYSAPAWVAFVYAVPFAIGIVVCVVVTVVLRKKSKVNY